jgi:hypothetical protein
MTAVVATNGTDILVLIEGNVVGSQRDASFDEKTESIDASSKVSRAKRVLPGRYSGTVSLEALYVPTDTAFQSLLSAMRNGTFVTVRRQENGAGLEEAEAIVTSLKTGAPDQDVSIVSAELEIDDEWVELGT